MEIIRDLGIIVILFIFYLCFCSIKFSLYTSIAIKKPYTGYYADPSKMKDI